MISIDRWGCQQRQVVGSLFSKRRRLNEPLLFDDENVNKEVVEENVNDEAGGDIVSEEVGGDIVNEESVKLTVDSYT